MKEVLIYGALVAAVMAAAIPMITSFTSNARTQGAAMNTALTTQSTALLAAINTSGT